MVSKAEEYISKINHEIDGILEKISGISEDVINWKPHDNVWSIKEILCHVEEANQFWLSDFETTKTNPQKKWGRGLQHLGRLEGVEKAQSVSLADVVKGIRATKVRTQEVLSPVSDEELDQTTEHVNPKFGTKPLSYLLEHFMVEHLEGHKNQIARNLRQYQETNY